MGKDIIRLLFVLLIITSSIVGCKNKDKVTIAIEEYKEYDKYGIEYTDNESEAYKKLEDLLPISSFNLVLEEKNTSTYITTDEILIKDVKNLLKLSKQILEVGYIRGTEDKEIVEGYYIDYMGNDFRAIISYYSSGYVRKTIYFNDTNIIIEVASDLTKTQHKNFR